MESFVQLTAGVLHVFLTLPIITQWAVAVLIAVGVLVHVFVYNETTIHDGPSLFTTGGIFFTFLGIAEGLYGFDPKAIELSVPTLLNGLKTAFVASVIGVGLALSIKLRHLLFPRAGLAEGDVAGGATIDHLHQQLVDLKQAIVGSDDATLLSQLKLTRQDSNDRLDALRKSQAEFMQQMAESNSKALISALEQVIRDFNTKISEQFGENFKQLNVAVGRLLEWQQQYRLVLDRVIEVESEAAGNMKLASERYGEILANAQTFSDVAERLSSILSGLETQRTQIESSARSLGELLTKASDSLPQLQNKIMQLTEQMTFGVKHHQDEMTSAVRDASAALERSIGDIKTSLLQTTQSHNQEINSHIKQLSEKTSEQLQKLDVALEKELTKALTTLGSQLTSLSKQFVDDYSPLTQRLREFVQATRVS